MKNLREKFEALPEIISALNCGEGISWSEDGGCYTSPYECDTYYTGHVNGVWKMFKAQQKQYEGLLELQNKLNKLKETADWHIEDCCCNHPVSQYELGWFEAMTRVKEILK